MEIKALIESLKKVLCDDERFYQIPDYQRPYSWDKDNVSDLISDLVTSYINNIEENYFCGSLVLVQGDKGRLDIIDGQQRVTTFTILACVIRDLYYDILDEKQKDYIKLSIQDKYENTKRKLKFLTNDKYQLDFEETVLKKINFVSNKNDYEKDFPKNRYLQNAHFIRDNIKENFVNFNIDVNKFVIWLYEKVVLTTILCPNADSAIRIFNVLNDRGMPLSPIDILKSSLMQRILNEEDKNTFKVSWEAIITKLEFDDIAFEDMLNSYLYYKLGDNPSVRIDTELMDIFKKENKLENPLEIISEIKKFSDSYIEILTLKNKYIFCLKYLKHRIYWTSILASAKFVKYKDFDKLIKYLMAYYYQNWIAGKTVANIKQTSFNIIKSIKKDDNIDEIIKLMQENLKKYETTNMFENELNINNHYERNWAKPLLILVEYFWTDSQNEQQSFIPLSSKLHLEHILPQTTNEFWNNIFTIEQREIWTNSLANLVLLSLRKNIQAQNYDFNSKKEAYFNNDNVVTSFHTTRDIKEICEWNEKELKLRKDKLVNKINEIISIF
ncbi:DUF262 domain-containing HNH endonuclease family protein [Aliarcobacter cryaerophilus]|uniref:DUF262 domain-containing protein n=1 Tax=Aliarcobacter cryaerophilus TaxID=28198 RepID=UPI0021B56DA5|nr:DUF262 domain-containing HNH endonuclease family protein [Aliarcobacter cryaerophilus]MCT7545226.1 DUF262 domain-containing HNH endonuclease family protein [Aliarcobacter cryaerophilus]